MASGRGRFRASLPPADIVFNRTLMIYIMKLECDSVLHIVDKDTIFSFGAFLLSGESTDDIWYVYLMHWLNPYIGNSNSLHDDQCPQFQSQKRKSLLQPAGIWRFDYGVESHNSLGIGERYRSFLQHISRKSRAQYSKLSKVA